MLETIHLLFDFGLVVLIWLVQLVVYPSFHFFSKGKLLEWHSIYTRRVTYVVLPLMLGQLVLSILLAFQYPSFGSLGILILVIGAWVVTFVCFVPIHQQISLNNVDPNLLKRLVSLNWIRTILWTLIFVWGLCSCFLNKY